jgi:hypothetical protein
MSDNKRMGSTSVDTSTQGIRFADGTYQTTAAVPVTSAGNTITLDNTGITMTDPFGDVFQLSQDYAFFSLDNSGGGVSVFYDGANYGASISDGNGNALLLGDGFGNFNLSNESGHAGIISASGDTCSVYGNPLFLGVAGGVGITISPSGISLDGVVVSTTPPTAGQVLTASSPTAAGWVTPAGGATKTARVDMGTIASATPSLVTTYTWPTAFADNNYTINGSVVILETPPASAATAIVCVGSIELLANGTGFNFVICNADGLSHHVIAQFIAVHD